MKSQRRRTEERKIEIIRAALELAEGLPIQKVTTREIAARVNISQPAVYRHFMNRDRLFEAVIEHVRGELEARAQDHFKHHDAAQPLTASVKNLMQALAEFPGFPRFFFYYFSQDKPSRAKNQLQHLRAMIQALVAEMIRSDERYGAKIDAKRAASYLVALIQGMQLQVLNGGGESRDTLRRPFKDCIDEWVEFWEAGLVSGCPAREQIVAQSIVAQSIVAQSISEHPFVKLDVRADIEGGRDPFERIMTALKHLEPFGIMVLLAPFKPAPLTGYLHSKGYSTHAEEGAEGWRCVFWKGAAFHDFSDRPAPEPMELTLGRITQLQPDRVEWFALPRFPQLLLPHLQQRGVDYQVFDAFEKTFLRLILKEKTP